MFSFKSIVLIAVAFVIGAESSGVPAVAAPLVAPAAVGYAQAIPQNVPPFASQISVVNRAVAPLAYAQYAAAPYVAGPVAAPYVGAPAPYVAGPVASPYVTGPVAPAPYLAGPAPYAAAPLPYAAPFPYSAPLLRAPYGAPAFVR